jgi:hypothetical protein
MNRACTLATLVLILAAGRLDAGRGSDCRLSRHSLLVAAAAADPSPERGAPPAVLEAAPAGTVVMDDDGGRVQIVTRAAAPGGEITDHGGPVVTRAAVQLIFLGSGWRDAANRGREAGMTQALAESAAAAAPRSGGASRSQSFSLPPREDRLDPAAGRTISDLEIQARLDELLANGTIGPLAVDSVYVVLLAPGIRSTLGSTSSETDFTAYHNFFHAAPGLVRYVVVPYEPQLSRWLASARQGLTQALVNPEGTGWY